MSKQIDLMENKMKRFLLFVGEWYYPGPAFEQFLNSFETKEEAFTAGNNSGEEWFQIVDMLERKYETWTGGHLDSYGEI